MAAVLAFGCGRRFNKSREHRSCFAIKFYDGLLADPKASPKKDTAKQEETRAEVAAHPEALAGAQDLCTRGIFRRLRQKRTEAMPDSLDGEALIFADY